MYFASKPKMCLITSWTNFRCKTRVKRKIRTKAYDVLILLELAISMQNTCKTRGRRIVYGSRTNPNRHWHFVCFFLQFSENDCKTRENNPKLKYLQSIVWAKSDKKQLTFWRTTVKHEEIAIFYHLKNKLKQICNSILFHFVGLGIENDSKIRARRIFCLSWFFLL